MKIVAIVESIGLGHAMRTMETLKQFRQQGWQTTVIASDIAADLFRRNDVATTDVSLSIMLKETNGKLDVGKTMLENIKVSNVTALGKINTILQREKPDLLLVDTNIIGMIAASFYKNSHKTPILFMGSDNMYKYGSVKKENKKQDWQLVDSFVQATADAYLIPDVPPPYTISGYNIMLKEKMIFVGPLSWVIGKKLQKKTNGVLLTQGKSGIEMTALDALGARVIRATEKDYENKFLASEIVIHHGGHETAMACIVAEKPQIIIPVAGYMERINNGKKIEELKLGRMLHDQWIDENVVQQAIEEVRTYKPNIKKFAEFARSYNAPKRIYEICQQLLEEKASKGKR